MARANPQDRFAGGTGRGPALTLLTDDGDLVRRTYAAVMRRGAVRRALHARGRDHQLDKAHSRAYAHDSALAKLRDQMSRFARAGCTLEELLRIPELLYEHAFLLKGPARRSLDALDLEESRIDAEEDVIQLRRRIRGETPATNREEADLAARLATINTERAIALRARAEQLEPAGACA